MTMTTRAFPPGQRRREAPLVVGSGGRVDLSWRKARIAARILLKMERGEHLAPRDFRLSARLKNDPAVTNRLLDQAVHFTRARQHGLRLMA